MNDNAAIRQFINFLEKERDNIHLVIGYNY